MHRFHDVATQYLENYLGCRRMLERYKTAFTPKLYLAETVGRSINSQLLQSLNFNNVGILRPAYPAQTELEIVTLEQLVPKDHLLRCSTSTSGLISFAKRHSICIARTMAALPLIRSCCSRCCSLVTCSGFAPNLSQCRLRLVSRLSPDRQGAGCLDAVAEPSSPLCRDGYRATHLRRHRRTSDRTQAD